MKPLLAICEIMRAWASVLDAIQPRKVEVASLAATRLKRIEQQLPVCVQVSGSFHDASSALWLYMNVLVLA
jgi:hypothetical protein